MTKKIFCISLVVLFSIASHAKQVRVVTEILSPYQYFSAEGKLTGYMTEFVTLLFANTEYEPAIEVLPWARAYKTALTNQDVMIYSMVATEERKDKFHWIGSLPSAPIYLWGLKDKKAPADLSNDVKYLRVATVRASNVERFLEKQGYHFIVSLPSESVLTEMLQLNRVDLVASSEPALKMRLQNSPLRSTDLQRVIQLEGLNMQLSAAFNKNSDPKLVAQLNESYRLLEKSGQLAQLKNKWLGF